jgi:hypothetical protein
MPPTDLATDTDLKDDFRIKFDGKTNQIDANTFVNYLLHFNTLVQEVNRELAPERKIRVKINALEPGSFDVAIELQSYLLKALSLLSNEKNVSYLNNIMGIISGLIALKLFLKGDAKPTTVVQSADGKVTVTSPDGNTLIISAPIYNIYNTNTTVNQAIAKQFETLEQDPSVEGLELSTGDKTPLVSIPREAFPVLAQEHPQDEAGLRHEMRHTLLSIVKLSFDPKLKSDFIYMNIRISAYIKDKTFYESVDKGKAFSKGDKLEVNLRVNLAHDISIQEDIIKTYEIIDVIRHIPRNDPGQLELSLAPSSPSEPYLTGIDRISTSEDASGASSSGAAPSSEEPTSPTSSGADAEPV